MCLLWLIAAGSVALTASLPQFLKCDKAGWSCVHNDVSELIYTCDDNTGWDTTVDLDVEDIHYNTHTITVQYCKNVSLTLHQQYRNLIKSITMQDINELNLVDSMRESSHESRDLHNPPIVIFRNIGLIPVIPGGTFTYYSGIKAEHITIENVTIGKIEHLAFNILDTSLIINKSIIKLVDTRAITIYNRVASITITNSKFDYVEHKAFVFFAPEVKIFKCKFPFELREQSLEVITDSFFFYLNDVNMMHSNALNITAENITIVSNNFQNISGGAFEEVHPLYNDEVQFFYQFRENIINYAEPLALHHNWYLHEQSVESGAILVTDNHFNCTCALSGFRNMNINLNTRKSSKFESLLLDDTNECMNTKCNLPFRMLNLVHNESSNCLSLEELNSLCSLVTINSSLSKQPELLVFVTVIVLIMRSLY